MRILCVSFALGKESRLYCFFKKLFEGRIKKDITVRSNRIVIDGDIEIKFMSSRQSYQEFCLIGHWDILFIDTPVSKDIMGELIYKSDMIFKQIPVSLDGWNAIFGKEKNANPGA